MLQISAKRARRLCLYNWKIFDSRQYLHSEHDLDPPRSRPTGHSAHREARGHTDGAPSGFVSGRACGGVPRELPSETIA